MVRFLVYDILIHIFNLRMRVRKSSISFLPGKFSFYKTLLVDEP